MPEATAEHLPTPEVQKASNALMLHLAHGETDISKTALLDKNPKNVSQRTFDALTANHRQIRQQQQDEQYQRMKEQAEQDPEFQKTLTPEMLRHSHFVAWAQTETARIAFLLMQQQGNNENQQLLKGALARLHIVLDRTITDDKIDPSKLEKEFYTRTGSTTGDPGKFYTEFCTGDSNQKLINTLSEQEIVLLKDFLVDMLGSTTAYDTLLATKQTDDAIKANHNFSAGNISLAPHEQPILAFVKKGEKNLPKASSPTVDNASQQSEIVKKYREDVFASEAVHNPEAHKQLMNDTIRILEEEKNKGRGLLGITIQETAQGPHGKEVIHDGYVVYLPAGPGERIVTIGDIHGDLATIQQILEKEQFFEDMASGSPKIQLVFQGDLVDRGPKSVEVMTAIMKLKTLYKDRVHIIAADHDTTSPNISSHDFPDKLKKSFGSDSDEIYQLYDQVFKNMAKMVVTGNGIVIVHGGPAAEPLNLAQIGRLEDTDTNGIIGEQFSWSDPIAQPNQGLETVKAQTLQNYEYIVNWAATQPNLNDKSVIKMPGPNNANLEIKDIKQAIELLKNLPVGEYPNPTRAGSGLMIDALFQGLLYYDQRAFDSFMQRIGGKVMMRGHQVSDDVEGGKPNLFGDRLWTIHSTGTGSPESYYSRREDHPKYATFDLGSDLSEINQVNIKNVW